MARLTDDIPRSDPKPLDFGGKPLACLLCGAGTFWTATERLQTGGGIQPRARLGDPDTRLVVCSTCGFCLQFVH